MNTRKTRMRLIALLAAILMGPASIFATGKAPADNRRWESQRKQMVAFQIRARGIRHPDVLRALTSVPRHRFVPYRVRQMAYQDTPLPIGAGQTISQPYIVALMSTVLELDRTKKVLEIGTGSGYQAAVLGELAGQVYSIEIVPSLGETARRVLKDLGYANVHVRIGDGYQGWPDNAPFDAVIVTCAPTHVPQPLQDQLAEGGRLVIPVGPAGDQELVLLKKINGKIRQQKIIPVRFVPMVDKKGRTY
ncbi:MAG: Protein-L-isoaspartate O-methyltransferase (EC 2.1.1.77) [Olavius algarvensis Delta 4 endosymbiont]|nr:MAG: Protein-L-isoaspartate O-methyltransferase (EC 2.1.1.77) [Olavius algarvensis Delta 4 endosymbiont]